jgi:hypothetical protein
MMRGLAIDAAAPLYGRAREILEIEPLPFPTRSAPARRPARRTQWLPVDEVSETMQAHSILALIGQG